MTMKVRALAVLGLMAATIWVSGCGHFNCTRTFGAGTCSAGGGTTKTGGGGGPTGGLYLLIADAGGIQGEVVDPTTKTIVTNPLYHGQNVPVNDTNVPGDWMVIAGGKFMYTGYTSVGEIYGWSLNADGTLTDLTSISGGQILHVPYLINASGGLQFIITNPAGTQLFVADTTTDQVHVYTIGATDGGLTEVLPAVQLPSGFTPFNLATDGLGKYLYVSNGVGFQTTQVAEFSVGSNGVLTAVSGSPISSNLQQMQGDASGRFMIGTSGDIFGVPGNLYIASIQSTGALGSPTQVTTTGQPNTIVVQSNTGGNLVYTIDNPTNGQVNGAIEGFTLDSSTGTLTAIQGMGIQNGFIGHFDQTGQYLFVSSNPNQAHVGLNVYDVSADPTLSTALAGVAWSQGAWMPFNTQ